MRQRFNIHHGLVLFAMVLLPLFLLQTTPGQNPASTNSSASTTSSYIVQAESAAMARDFVIEAGGRVTATLTIIDAVGARLNDAQVSWLRAQQGQIIVFADAKVEVSGSVEETHYPTLVSAETLHQQGITGDGVTVAVLDTGLWKTRATAYNARRRSRILAEFDATQQELYGDDDDDTDHGISGLV